MENPLFKLTKRLCDGKHGFKVSDLRDGSGRDITFNRGKEPYRQEICVSDDQYRKEVWLTYWNTPTQFKAADRVRIKCMNIEQVEYVLQNIPRDFEEIISTHRFYRHEHSTSSTWLSGEMPFEKFMELEKIRLNTGASCNGCEG